MVEKYYERIEQLKPIQDRKLEDQLREAEEYEISFLNNTQELIMKAESRRLINRRFQYHQNEKRHEQEMVDKIDERESWRNMLSSDDLLDNERPAEPQQQQQQELPSEQIVDSPKEKPRVILLMTVDIGDGRVDTIRVREGDDFRELAIEFQNKHGLLAEIVDPLAEHIQVNVESLNQPTMSSSELNVTATSSASSSSTTKRPKSRSKIFSRTYMPGYFTSSTSNIFPAQTGYPSPFRTELRRGQGRSTSQLVC